MGQTKKNSRRMYLPHKPRSDHPNKIFDLYQRIVNNAPDLIYHYRVQPHRGYQYINDAVKHILGYQPEDFYKDPELPYKIIYPEDHAYMERMMEGLQVNPISVVRWIHKDGRVIFTEQHTNYLYDSEGQVLAIEGYAKDITLHKVTETALFQTKDVIERFIHTCPIAICITSIKGGTFIDVNESFCNTMGIPRENILGSSANHLKLWHTPGDQDILTEQVKTRKSIKDYEICFHTKDDSIITMLASLEVIDYANQECILAMMVDITDQKQHEFELEAITSLSTTLRTATTRPEMYRMIVDQVRTLLKTDGVGLIVLEVSTGQVILKAASGVWAEFSETLLPYDHIYRELIIASQQTSLNNDIENEPGIRKILSLKGLTAIASSTMAVKGTIIGSLWIGRKSRIAIQEVRILAVISDIAANAIFRASLHEQTQQYARQLANITQIGRKLAATLSLPDIYASLAQSIFNLLPDIQTVYISRYDPSTQVLTCVYGQMNGLQLDVSRLPALQLKPPLRNIQFDVIQNGKPLIVNNFHERLTPTEKMDLKLDNGQVTQSAMYIPMSAQGRPIGIIQIKSYLPNRFIESEGELMMLVGNTAAIVIQNASLFDDLQISNHQVMTAYDATIEGWARALELRDQITEGHTRRVAELSVKLGEKLGLSEEELIQLRRGAQLHDIGKMGIPDNILLKPGPLTDDEWQIMRRHPVYAYEMLSTIDYLKPALDIPYHHHEKWNGVGYPDGLKGDDIPITARIFSIVDVWDALSSDRPYRVAWSREKVFTYIREQEGRQFDPKVVKAFFDLMDAEDLPTD